MSMYHVYLYHDKVVVPQVVETQAGFYIDSLPVEVFNVKDIVNWQKHIITMFGSENITVETPESESQTGSLILDKLNIDKWSDFEADATMYTIHFSPGYKTIYSTITGADKTWQVEPNIRKFASFAPLSAILQALSTELLMEHSIHKSKKNLLKITG